MRDLFIVDIALPAMSQCLLEHKTLDLQTAYNQGSASDVARHNNDAYATPMDHTAASMNPEPHNHCKHMRIHQ